MAFLSGTVTSVATSVETGVTTLKKRYVAYYRVSTRRQGESGLGLEAQKDAVHRFVGEHDLVAEVEEVESGGRSDRPALEAALRECRLRAATLLIAKLDRLSRSVAFISRLQEQGVDFVACDNPHANTFTVQIMAAMAEFERKLISERTKVALAAAKARGVKLGGRRGEHRIEDHGAAGRRCSAKVRSKRAEMRAHDHLDVVQAIRAEGASSLRAIATGLNERAVPAPKGGSWSASQVRRVLARAPS